MFLCAFAAGDYTPQVVPERAMPAVYRRLRPLPVGVLVSVVDGVPDGRDTVFPDGVRHWIIGGQFVAHLPEGLAMSIHRKGGPPLHVALTGGRLRTGHVPLVPETAHAAGVPA